MDAAEYREKAKEMVDFIADYLEGIRERRVYPDVRPGYMRSLVPSDAPYEPEDWDKIMKDVNSIILPGITHWQSPHMHAYFPGLNSYPSLLGDMMADAINCLGFTWASSPACTELEIIVMDWLGKMIGLPDEFLHGASNGEGGGVIQTTVSESTLVSLLAGRTEMIRKQKEILDVDDEDSALINSRLVAYCSDQAHSSVEKAGLIGLVKMRYIESDENLSMKPEKLTEAIKRDRSKGLIPFFVCATLGTTGACAFDNLSEIGPICRTEGLWLHVDAAYAGTSFLCPEYRHWLKGVECASSVVLNCSKWMMMHFDCTALWTKNCRALHRTFTVEPLYLQHENSGMAIDFMHWQIPLSRRFRALKMWFVIRKYGVSGLQKHVREGVRLAQKFELLVTRDPRFEVPFRRHLGLVIFRLVGENILTERLLKRLNSRGKIHCVPASLQDKYVIRFTVTSQRTTDADIINDWLEIKTTADWILSDTEPKPKERVPLGETKEKNELFGSSLLLANSPLSPKIVNGSFAAIFDTETSEWTKGWSFLGSLNKGSPIRRKMFKGKQFSLDSRLDLVQYCLGLSVTKRLPPCTEGAACTGLTDATDEGVESLDEDRKCCRSKSASESENVFENNGETGEHKAPKVCLKCGHFCQSNPIQSS